MRPGAPRMATPTRSRQPTPTAPRHAAWAHLLYGENLLGNVGKVWMSVVSALAFIGAQNSTVNGLSQICDGMTKVNMMPRFFSRKNCFAHPRWPFSL